jgi:hypothetical protein
MVAKKKSVRKKNTRRVYPDKSSKKISTRGKDSNDKVEKVLIENFISLQKVLTNLSIKFDGLSSNISKLLDLFEISAKALAEKDFDMSSGGSDNTEVLDKIDSVLEQNKIIARGLTLMHEKVGDVEQPQSAPIKQISPPSLPRPSFVGNKKETPKASTAGYEKSLY